MHTPNSNSDLDLLLSGVKSAASPLRGDLNEFYRRYKPLSDGKVADYIPELALADPNWFGIAIATTQGQVFEVGDSARPFTIQSISKPLIYGMVLEDLGREAVLARIGVEPSGEAFNSIVLDQQSNRPFNPMVNAGAIAAVDLIEGDDYTDRYKRMMKTFERYVGHELHIDNAVFLSERRTGHRNRAIAHLMLNFGMIRERVEETLELYFQQCAIMITCRDLALIGATLANGGVNPVTGERALASEYIKDVLSIMLSCGMYDYAGEWAFRIGLPAKSGVGGGIVAVIPGVGGVATFSPPLDEKGNSVRGIRVFRDFAERYRLHCLEPTENRNTRLMEMLGGKCALQ